MKSRVSEALQQAIGPAPWYWRTFPKIPRSGGRSFEWRPSGNAGANAFLVTLIESEHPDLARMALGTYTRPFLIPSTRLGLWFEREGAIQLLCFEPDALPAFSTSAIPENFRRDRNPFFCTGALLTAMTVPCGLAEGSQIYLFPDEFHGIEVLFAIASNPHAGPRDAYCSILEMHPSKNRISVYPQKWFTSEVIDVGYQWITRAARDPVTGRLVGDGIRIDGFELSEDGCNRVGKYSWPAGESA